MANPYISEQGKATRFKPGQSGNPKGRPKGSRNRKTVLREVIQEYGMDWSKIPMQNVQALAAKYEYPIDAIICVAIAKAMEGDAQARRWLSETLYGKPKANVTVHHVTDKPQPVPIYDGSEPLGIESQRT